MILELENASLISDLDANNQTLRNCDQLLPVPLGLVGIDDVRLTNQRTPTSGSVTNAKVSDTAGISQSKLSLDGQIPASWMGSGATQAAQGNLVERAANKNTVGGYVGLDANGQVPMSRLPTTGPQTGTVTNVGLKMPSELSVSGSPITTSGNFTVSLVNQPDKSWFGCDGPTPYGGFFLPSFKVKELPIVLIPDFSATKILTGTLNIERCPVMEGLGLGHSQGMVPDTGDGTTGHLEDYLGRDGKWRHFDKDNPIQPTVPNVVISVLSYSGNKAVVSLQEKLSGASLFYRVFNASVSVGGLFSEASITPGSGGFTLTLLQNQTVQCYSAKAGYNNSEITQYTVIIPGI